MSTKDSIDNEVEIIYNDDKTSVNVAMKKPFLCYGDADTLIQLGLYKVDQ